MKGHHSYSDGLLSTRVARIIVRNTVAHQECNEQTISFLSHVIRAFSNSKCSIAFQAASAGFKSFIRGIDSASNLSPEASELCLLFSACLKSVVHQEMKPRLQVRLSCCRRAFVLSFVTFVLTESTME
jgi:hypothetical protein